MDFWRRFTIFYKVKLKSKFKLYYFILFFISINLSSPSPRPRPPVPVAFYDEDVERETQRIQLMSKSEIAEKNLILDQITKYYRDFLAVNSLSLCVDE